jgi:hypothetical protein
VLQQKECRCGMQDCVEPFSLIDSMNSNLNNLILIFIVMGHCSVGYKSICRDGISIGQKAMRFFFLARILSLQTQIYNDGINTRMFALLSLPYTCGIVYILLLQRFWFSGKKTRYEGHLFYVWVHTHLYVCVCNNTMTQSTVPRCGDRSFSGKKSAITYC